MKKTRAIWIIIGGVIILGAAGFYWLNGSGKSDLSYRLEKVTRGDVVVSISATGTLNAVTTVQVGSQVSGTISKLYADFNSLVKEGQLLAQLDPTFLQASVNEQRASVDRTRAQVNEAERTFRRVTDLFNKSLVSQADLDAATTSLESARASAKQAEAALERVVVNLRYATIRSPISGVVISRNVDVGQTVAASLQAPTIFTIANDLRKMQVEANVDEADIGQVNEGQVVTFRVDAYPNDEFDGKVSQIRLAPIISQNVVTYNVIISVDNPEQKLMPGMTATLSIEVARKEDVLRVPIQALRFTPPPEAVLAVQDSTEAAQQRRPGGAEQGERSARQGSGGGGWDQGARRAGGGEGQGGRRRQGGGMRAQLWVLEKGKLKPVRAVRGIQNTQFVELVRTELQEGDEVIMGVIGGTTQATTPGQNPFMPQSGRGPRRGF